MAVATRSHKKKRTPTPNEIIESFDPQERDMHYYLAANPVAFSRVALNFVPHRAQEEVLTADPPLWKRNTILAWSRQAGKSKVCAAVLLHSMIFNPRMKHFLMSPSGKLSHHVLDYMLDFLGQSSYCQEFVKYRLKGDCLSIGDESWGSTCTLVRTSLHGQGSRGYHTDNGLVLYDEFSSFYDCGEIAVVTGQVAASGGGRCIISSPSWKFGDYWNLYQFYKTEHEKGNPRYLVVECDVSDLKHITPEYLEEQRLESERTGNTSLYERECLGRWLTPSNCFFDEDCIRRAEVPQVNLCKGGLHVWSIDPGGKKSPCVICISTFNPELGRLEVGAVLTYVRKGYRYKLLEDAQEIDDYSQLIEICLGLSKQFGRPQVFYHDSMCEASLADMLANQGFNMVPCAIGSYQRKLAALEAVRRACHEGRLVWSDTRISDQLRAYAPTIRPDGRYEFADKLDDIISNLCMQVEYFGDNRPSIFAVRRIPKWE